MPSEVWRLFGALALGAIALGAQELPPPLPGNTFGSSVDVRVVNVEAVVTDSKGERVRGLAAGDFVLEVDGREVPIEYFTEMEGGRAESPPPSPSAAEKGAPSPVVSQAAVGRSLLVFVDDLFSVAQQRDTVLGALEKSLALLRPEDRMAIVAFFSGRVDVLSGWTGDRKALAAALQAARKRPALGHDVVATRRSQQYEAELVSQALALSDPDGGAGDDLSGARGLEIGAPGGTASTGDPRLDGRLSKLARAAVATMYAMTPPSGRRTLIVLSGGWPVPHLHISLALAANRLGYTVYPVDVQGIDTALIVNDASLDHSTPDSFITAPWKRVSQDGMELLARMTGGRAILNSARLTALDRVMEDTNSYYWLGFAPSWKGDDRHHPISVKARRKDLKVRSRRGFSDLSRATEATMTAQGILLVGGDERTKKLTIETDPLGRKGKVVEVGVTVAIPLADLTPVEQDGKWKVEATLAAAALDKGGLFSDLTEIPLHLTLPRKPAPDAVARYHTRMKLSRVEQRLVVTVRDPLGGAAVWGETEIKP